MKVLRRYLTLLILSIAASPSPAQQTIGIQLFIAANPSPYLYEWQVGNETAQMVVNNAGNATVEAKVRTVVSRNGLLQAETDDDQMEILRFAPGLTTLDPAVIIPYEAVNFIDDVDQTVTRSGKLPAGVYQICVDLIHPLSHESLTSNPVCRFFRLTDYQAPILLQPLNAQQIPAEQSSRILFRWTPVVPSPADGPGAVTYTLRLFEIMPAQRPMQAFRANLPILEAELAGLTQLLWPPDVELPRAGRRYIWSVRATDDEDRPLGDADGYAEPFSFELSERIGEFDEDPFQIDSELEPTDSFKDGAASVRQDSSAAAKFDDDTGNTGSALGGLRFRPTAVALLPVAVKPGDETSKDRSIHSALIDFRAEGFSVDSLLLAKTSQWTRLAIGEQPADPALTFWDPGNAMLPPPDDSIPAPAALQKTEIRDSANILFMLAPWYRLGRGEAHTRSDLISGFVQSRDSVLRLWLHSIELRLPPQAELGRDESRLDTAAGENMWRGASGRLLLGMPGSTLFSSSGKELLAHELTHSRQQRAADPAADPLESYPGTRRVEQEIEQLQSRVETSDHAQQLGEYEALLAPRRWIACSIDMEGSRGWFNPRLRSLSLIRRVVFPGVGPLYVLVSGRLDGSALGNVVPCAAAADDQDCAWPVFLK